MPHTTAILDTGASDHYFTTAAPLLHINQVAPPTTIRTASGKTCVSSATVHLAILTIPTLHARTGHIMPGFAHNLLSLGKLCDAGCTATVDKDNIFVRDPNGTTILQGQQEPTGAQLWRVNITDPAAAQPPPPRCPPPPPPPQVGPKK